MTFVLTVIAFVVIFSVLVLIHEWGHFVMARRAGIKVEEFGFGLPPRIWGVKKGETIYSINLIPFGGFVRLLGEDSHDPKIVKNKRSFISKPPRVRMMVVIAGVVMNFLLALALLTVGFIFGIQPLILNGEDVFKNINNGNIQIANGVLVKKVVPGSSAELVGLKKDDILLNVAETAIYTTEQLDTFAKKNVGKAMTFEVARDDQRYSFPVQADEKVGFGFELYEVVRLPRVVVIGVKADSASAKAGLQPDDVILSINGQPLYFINELEEIMASLGELELTVLRSTGIERLLMRLPQQETVVITEVLADSRADKAGFKRGDIIVEVNGRPVRTPQQVIGITREFPDTEIIYKVRRQGNLESITVKADQNGLIGVWLAMIVYHENSEFSYYPTEVPVSVLEIKDVSYPFWLAPLRALEESGRLAVLTVQMFGNVVKSVFTQFVVPEGVAGPVGIAQMTYVFVQEGVLSLLRFMALLSLSLAIINVLPFPALDGGRLFFILAEVVVGRRIGAKFESIIHAIGFVVLMLLIFAVTYSDILRIF